jgi:alpha-galactosidase/6-phospho-beta-glucosidase family protein
VATVEFRSTMHNYLRGVNVRRHTETLRKNVRENERHRECTLKRKREREKERKREREKERKREREKERQREREKERKREREKERKREREQDSCEVPVVPCKRQQHGEVICPHVLPHGNRATALVTLQLDIHHLCLWRDGVAQRLSDRQRHV